MHFLWFTTCNNFFHPLHFLLICNISPRWWFNRTTDRESCRGTWLLLLWQIPWSCLDVSKVYLSATFLSCLSVSHSFRPQVGSLSLNMVPYFTETHLNTCSNLFIMKYARFSSGQFASYWNVIQYLKYFRVLRIAVFLLLWPGISVVDSRSFGVQTKICVIFFDSYAYFT